MKFLISFDPPAEVKNEFERNPTLQKKLGEHMQKLKPIAGWFSWRYGFLVVEANSWEEIGRIISPFNQVFKMDVKVGPAIPFEEFGKAVQIASEAANQFASLS
jgi:hypothetical protein